MGAGGGGSGSEQEQKASRYSLTLNYDDTLGPQCLRANYVATEHYARTEANSSGKVKLLKALDDSRVENMNYIDVVETLTMTRALDPMCCQP